MKRLFIFHVPGFTQGGKPYWCRSPNRLAAKMAIAYYEEHFGKKIAALFVVKAKR